MPLRLQTTPGEQPLTRPDAHNAALLPHPWRTPLLLIRQRNRLKAKLSRRRPVANLIRGFSTPSVSDIRKGFKFVRQENSIRCREDKPTCPPHREPGQWAKWWASIPERDLARQ